MKTFWISWACTNRDDAGPGGLVEIGPHVVELAITPASAVGALEAQDGNAVLVAEVFDRLTEAVPDLLEQRRGRDRIAEVLAQEGRHLAAHLKVGNVGAEIDAIDAFEVEYDMAVEDIADAGLGGVRHRLLQSGMLVAMRWGSEPSVFHEGRLGPLCPSEGRRFAITMNYSAVRGWPH
jgi:hypothetical protein